MEEAAGPTNSTVVCPVPPAQRPLQQYEELRDSLFFRWPARGNAGLGRSLLLSWLLLFMIAFSTCHNGNLSTMFFAIDMLLVRELIRTR